MTVYSGCKSLLHYLGRIVYVIWMVSLWIWGSVHVLACHQILYIKIVATPNDVLEKMLRDYLTQSGLSCAKTCQLFWHCLVCPWFTICRFTFTLKMNPFEFPAYWGSHTVLLSWVESRSFLLHRAISLSWSSIPVCSSDQVTAHSSMVHCALLSITPACLDHLFDVFVILKCF